MCDFLTLHQHILLVFLVWSNGCICVPLLLLQVEIVEYFHFWCCPWRNIDFSQLLLFMDFQSQHTINQMVLVFLITAMLCSFGFILLLCEFGQRVNDSFEHIHDTINKFEWYMFPLEMQKLLPIMMNVADQQVTIKVFGNISCDRDTFKTVRWFQHAL